MKLSRLERKMIEEYWKDIDYYRDKMNFRFWQVTEQKEQDTNIGGGKSSDISDTTARKAMLIANDGTYQHYKKIVEAVEDTYEELDNQLKQIVHMRFWNKYEFIEWENIAIHLNVATSTVFRWRNYIIDLTAKKMGWL